jgi:phosphohistidine phosphatase SixA
MQGKPCGKYMRAAQVVQQLRKRTSEQAFRLLRTRWAPAAPADEGADDDAAEATAVADTVWQAHTQQLGEVLSVFCSCHENMEDTIVDITSSALAHVAVSGTAANKKHAVMVGGFPSLSSQTFHVWFRCAGQSFPLSVPKCI